MEEAKVVCRQLGYPDAFSKLDGGEVPSGSGRIWLDDIACTGKEENIGMCSHKGLGTHDCSHSEDAGVKCSRIGKATEATFEWHYHSGVSSGKA